MYVVMLVPFIASILLVRSIISIASMEHCIKFIFLLILVLLITGHSSGETALPSEQAQKMATKSTADLDNGVNHADPKDGKVSSLMQKRKMMITPEFMLDYEKPKHNPRHDDKGRPGSG
ncbi:hypothetical protein SAY86_028793 [Trapa natans]|uniref:Uncharacterized protein n=1 Tax=Trapa natans TaxID=22666 RepID=A0AAN7M1Z7_TRANT|nr:hypothetical protein SAY86_028793 [Trapa natans]